MTRSVAGLFPQYKPISKYFDIGFMVSLYSAGGLFVMSKPLARKFEC